MGWYYKNGSRKSLIESLTASNERAVCVAHATVGYGILWSVWEPKDGGAASRYIMCDLLHHHSGMWGHKPMDESMGPCYWSCPKKYLDMAPVANANWREGVLTYWAKRNARRAARKAA